MSAPPKLLLVGDSIRGDDQIHLTPAGRRASAEAVVAAVGAVPAP